MKRIWEAGNFPAPEWLRDQLEWFVWTDLDGTSWFQSTNDLNPQAVMLAPGGTVEWTDDEKWLFDGIEVTR